MSPVFKQFKIEKKPAGRPKGIPQEIVDSYKPYVEQLEKGNQGSLEFRKDENVSQARKALLQAATELKRYIKIRRQRNSPNILTFVRVTAQEWAASRKKGKKEPKKEKPEVEAKPKTKARKAPAKAKAAKRKKKE